MDQPSRLIYCYLQIVQLCGLKVNSGPASPHRHRHCMRSGPVDEVVLFTELLNEWLANNKMRRCLLEKSIDQ